MNRTRGVRGGARGGVLAPRNVKARPAAEAAGRTLTCYFVGDRGFEPLTYSVSGSRSPAELIAPEAEAGIEPAYRALQALA
jgi:hypothetical protein